ncbi:MAG: hypothetical protein AAF689_18715 [Pseudomonadota bacterium]
MANSKTICAALVLPILAACAPAPTPQPILPEPIFNKFGGVIGCTDGGVLADGSAGVPCLPPDDEDCVDIPGRPPCDPEDDRRGSDDRPDRDPDRPDRDPERPDRDPDPEDPDRDPDPDPDPDRPDRDPDPDGPDRDPAGSTPGNVTG